MYKINIPQTAKKIKIDIGLSYCAPNSAVWLNSDKETFVIGIEPCKEASKKIIDNGLYAFQTGDKIEFLHPHFYMLNAAIDDVEIKLVKNVLYEFPTKKFYLTKGDVGTSSLLKPIKHEVEKEYDVMVLPLWVILEGLDWNRFNYIELVKIDTQGKDLEVIKSAKEWLDKIVYLHCEINTNNEYEGSPKVEEFDEYLLSKGFKVVSDGSIVDGKVIDRLYLNDKWSSEAKNINPFVL